MIRFASQVPGGVKKVLMGHIYIRAFVSSASHSYIYESILNLHLPENRGASSLDRNISIK